MRPYPRVSRARPPSPPRHGTDIISRLQTLCLAPAIVVSASLHGASSPSTSFLVPPLFPSLHVIWDEDDVSGQGAKEDGSHPADLPFAAFFQSLPAVDWAAEAGKVATAPETAAKRGEKSSREAGGMEKMERTMKGGENWSGAQGGEAMPERGGDEMARLQGLLLGDIMWKTGRWEDGANGTHLSAVQVSDESVGVRN